MARHLLDALDRNALVLDGAMGTQLLASGFDAKRDFLGHPSCCEVLNLTRAEQVQAVHESYLDAGCDVLATNSFLAAPHQLAARGLGERAAEINRAAARSALAAVQAWSTVEAPRWVLGSLGPGPADPSTALADVEESWFAQTRWLAEEGVDGILLETFTDTELLPIALRAARRGLERARRPLPLFVSLAVGPKGQLGDGEPLEAIFDAFAASPPDLLALNCLGDFAELDRLLRRVRARWSGRLGTYPSAGLPTGEPPVWPISPEDFVAGLAELIPNHRLCLVGGCCGTRPRHIAELARHLGRPGVGEVDLAEDDFGEVDELDEPKEHTGPDGDEPTVELEPGPRSDREPHRDNPGSPSPGASSPGRGATGRASAERP